MPHRHWTSDSVAGDSPIADADCPLRTSETGGDAIRASGEWWEEKMRIWLIDRHCCCDGLLRPILIILVEKTTRPIRVASWKFERATVSCVAISEVAWVAVANHDANTAAPNPSHDNSRC